MNMQMTIPANDQMTDISPMAVPTDRYQKCIDNSKRMSWDIDDDVIRGRSFDRSQKYLPDGLTMIDEFSTLSKDEKRFVSQIQGWTYANVFGLAERFVNAKVLEVSQDHVLGDQVALEALVRFSDEELKHQALFRRIDQMIGETMPEGYVFAADPNEVAGQVLGMGTWAVLAITCDIELFTQSHYRQSIDNDPELSDLFRDVFKYHWREECQHAVLDELEWQRCDAAITDAERDTGVDEFIALVGAIDGILQGQAVADAAYFARTCGRRVAVDEEAAIAEAFLKAYRWQYIHSGAQHPHFGELLTGMITEPQAERIQAALSGLA